jgi:hypothetical protein
MRDKKPVQPLSGFTVGDNKFDVVGSGSHKGHKAVNSATKVAHFTKQVPRERQSPDWRGLM